MARSIESMGNVFDSVTVSSWIAAYAENVTIREDSA
ncbi:hypothetical protein A20C1_06561 [marine actinobacterium PHSC20C1]|nr:hypothetical protein A20C1_06561 [marine actinobacterium PHSC20C1]